VCEQWPLARARKPRHGLGRGIKALETRLKPIDA
jgi:hypothetical protein